MQTHLTVGGLAVAKPCLDEIYIYIERERDDDDLHLSDQSCHPKAHVFKSEIKPLGWMCLVDETTP